MLFWDFSMYANFTIKRDLKLFDNIFWHFLIINYWRIRVIRMIEIIVFDASSEILLKLKLIKVYFCLSMA